MDWIIELINAPSLTLGCRHLRSLLLDKLVAVELDVDLISLISYQLSFLTDILIGQVTLSLVTG